MLYVLAAVAALLVGAGYMLGMRRRQIREDELQTALEERTDQLTVAEQELIRHSAWQDIELIASAKRALAQAREAGRNTVALDTHDSAVGS